MKVLTFNIWNLFTSVHRRARMQAIAAMLREAAQGPKPWDLVLLQEMWPCPERRMFDGCGFAHVGDAERPFERVQNLLLAPALAFGFPWIMDSGLRILSRHPITAMKRLIFHTQFGWRDRLTHPERYIRKCAVGVRIEAPGLGPVWTVNTHLIAASRTGTQNAERWHQLLQLRRWMDTELGDAPVVLGGDLNMGPPIPGSHASENKPEFWERALEGPLAGYAVHAPSIRDATWTLAENPYVAACSDREVARLDHILAGSGLTIAEACVVLRDEVDLGPGVRGPLSDHFGYEATIARAG